MKILLIGGGGREHALAWKLAQSPKVESILAAPGNPGIAELPKCECVALNLDDLEKVADFAEDNGIELTVVGPEATLVAGIADVFKRRGLPVFGPSKAAAQLEGSKAFSKELMAKYDIPTAFFKVCEDIETAKAYVEEKGAPIVVKADGLAAGKGVVVAMTKEEALEAIDDMMADQKFGNAGARVVLEEYMEGEEAKKRGIVASVAHSDGDYSNTEEALSHGYSDITHIYSACSGMRKIGIFRHAGVVEAGLSLDGYTTQFIADLRHLPYGILKLIYVLYCKNLLSELAGFDCGIANVYTVGEVGLVVKNTNYLKVVREVMLTSRCRT